ncbi:MAG TPA: LppX_LprAFG lipoprotein [Chloroflexia bacterium]|nr:LppX_LprAFG lipoprotein [Chloroflexia bacterium]
MSKLRTVTLMGVFVLLLSTLAACGGDTPTVTVIAPTATLPAPTSTAVPPSNTAAPPSKTAVAVVPTSQVPGTTPAGGATGDTALIKEALAAGKTLKSFHFTIAGGGDMITQPMKLEGDHVAPDQAYVKGTMGGANIEQLATGGKTFRRLAGGPWILDSGAGEGSSSGPEVLDLNKAPNPLAGLDDLVNGGINYKAVGEESMNGVQTRHYSGTIDAGAMMGGAGSGPSLSLGSIELWIDPATKQLHRIRMALDLGPFFKMMNEGMAGLMGTPEPGTPSPTPFPESMTMNVDLGISRHNDPTIKVPDAPADAVVPPTATGTSGGDGPTTGGSDLTIAANAGYNTPDKALAVSGPIKAKITLGSPQDVVYLRFKAVESFTMNLYVHNPQDAGTLDLSITDAAGKDLLDHGPIDGGLQYSLGQGPVEAGTYLVRLAATAGEKVSKDAIKLEISGPSEQIQPTPTEEVEATPTTEVMVPSTTLDSQGAHKTPAQALAVTLPLNAKIRLAGPNDVLYLKFTTTDDFAPLADVFLKNPNDAGEVQVVLTDKTGAVQSTVPPVFEDDEVDTVLILKGGGADMGGPGTYYLKVTSNEELPAGADPIELKLKISE